MNFIKLSTIWVLSIFLMSYKENEDKDFSILLKLKKIPTNTFDCGYSKCIAFYEFETMDLKKVKVKIECPNELFASPSIDSVYYVKVKREVPIISDLPIYTLISFVKKKK